MSVNFTGKWRANLRRCRFIGPIPNAISVRIEQPGVQLQEEMVVTKPHGNEDRVLFKCSTNGEPDKSSLNGRPVRGTSRWEGDELVIESWIEFGAREMHFCDFWSLSPDRQTLIMEHRHDDLSGQFVVFDRVE